MHIRIYVISIALIVSCKHFIMMWEVSKYLLQGKFWSNIKMNDLKNLDYHIFPFCGGSHLGFVYHSEYSTSQALSIDPYTEGVL